MTHLEGKKALVTGGSKGIGLGIVEALVAKGVQVTALARGAAALAELAKRLPVAVRVGDVTDEALARDTLAELRPDILVLNAGASPGLGTIDQLTWDAFRGPWETDVKSTFFWLQAALRLPLARGSRVLIGSSGAAVKGSPISGAYAGAKRTQWFMAQYANVAAADRDLGVRFQAIVPLQMLDTDLGRAGAAGYAKRRGITVEAQFAGFGAPLTPRQIGDHVVTILSEPRYVENVAFGLKGDAGITVLE